MPRGSTFEKIKNQNMIIQNVVIDKTKQIEEEKKLIFNVLIE